MSRRLAALCAALLAAVLIAACGSPPAKTITKTVPQPVTTEPQKPGELPLETSRTPEGAKQAAPPVGIALAASLQKHISASGLLLIERFEGFGSCPYWDPYGHVSTRGFGETDFGGNFGGRCISVRQGTTNLRVSLENNYEWALRRLGVSLNQYQWNALCSFVWNLGAGIFTGTSVGSYLRARNWGAAASSMLQYVHAGGQVLAGLVTRRRAEVQLFLTPEHAAPVPVVTTATLVHIRAELRANLTRHRCRVAPYHGRGRYHRICAHWLHYGSHVNSQLRARGVH
jgi:GH24 family phage-related lysozyme (muramidase)